MFKSRTSRAIAAIALSIGIGVGAAACTSDADTVNQNISTDAEQFKVDRTIWFYNGITDKTVAKLVGKCSIERDAEKMTATCKVGSNPDVFTRDEIGRSDNMTYFAFQNDGIPADVYRKTIVFKPEGLVPDVDLEMGQQ